jgi:putative glutamine amidotransferase
MPENAAMTGSPAQPPRPLIGITTYREQARFGAWNSSADLLHATYARSVEAAGGVAVLLPPQNVGAVEVVTRLDAVVIAGGADVDPARYGASPHPRTQIWRPDRDAWEWALLDAADAAGRPVLGICRGMQLMAVRAGGHLEQHLPDVVGHSEHSPAPGAFGWTPIRTTPGSLVRRLIGEESQVNCAHHQAVVAHPGFEVTARAADGTAEAIEDPERGFWLAVQWHPEYGDDYGLFRGLVAAAAGGDPVSSAR